MQSSQLYMKDSDDFIKKIMNIGAFPKDAILVTGVVVLYRSIPHEAGLKALEKALNNCTNKNISTEDLVKMAKFVLKNNYFKFNSKVKQQILGTALGTKFTPPYTCICMDKVETSFLETHEMKPLICFRNIDVFFIWTHGQDKLDSFLGELNRCNSYLKFTYESNKTSIPFLDHDVSLSNGDLSTDLHIKSTDRYQCLHYTSSHPNHNKCSIIYSPALRISRICSNKSDFLKNLESMKSWFEVGDYPNKSTEREIF